MKNRFLVSASLLFVGFILFFPLTFLGSLQGRLTAFLFADLTRFVAVRLSNINKIIVDFSSDSISMYILVFLLIGFSFVIALLINGKTSDRVIELSRKIIVFYVAGILLKYGFDKVLKIQFYTPEPNILYSRFGDLDRDLLYWSTMGTSGTYSVILGGIEIISSVLLIFARTRILGLILSSIIFLQIIFINFSFDISVKLFSIILFLMTLFALQKHLDVIYKFFVLKQNIRLQEENSVFSKKCKPIILSLKIFVLGLVLVKILSPSFSTWDIKYDTAQKAFLHGVYKNIDKNSDIEYVFFHRNQYIILMNRDSETVNYHYENNDVGLFVLKNERGQNIPAAISYRKKDSLISITIDKMEILAKELDWKKMKALKPIFHFTVEGVE